LPLLRLVGQVASTYLVAEGPDGLYLIDQHAAHERVLFDQMMAQYRASTVSSQKLIDAIPVELSPEKAGILEANLATMASLGFEIELFGPNTFLIRSIRRPRRPEGCNFGSCGRLRGRRNTAGK
jgi:DNA mismatch repair protein MutL